MTRRRIEKEADYDRDVEVEALTMQLTDLIEAHLQETGVSRAELARRMGVSRGHITQTLSGQRNLTLRTVAEFLYELDARLEARVVPLRNTRPVERSVPREALSRAIDLWRRPDLVCDFVEVKHTSAPPSMVDAMRAFNAAVFVEAQEPTGARSWMANPSTGSSYIAVTAEVSEDEYAGTR